jgi:hypothetical protein
MLHFTSPAKISTLLDHLPQHFAKHIDHCIGPATTVKKKGSRSFQISFLNSSTGTMQLLQREAGMILLNQDGMASSFF